MVLNGMFHLLFLYAKNNMLKQYFSDPVYKIFIEEMGMRSCDKVVLIPGAYHTGICYLITPDGRNGWAYLFAKKDFRVYITDLPGTGRSGFVPFEQVNGNFIIQAYKNFINSLDGKIIILTHSLSGPFGFKLAELLTNKVSRVIAIEPGLLGNVQEASRPISENEKLVKIKFKGFNFNLDMKNYSYPTQQLIDRLTKINTKLFPKKSVDQYTASLQQVHPKLMYERFNINNSQVKIVNYAKLKNCRFLVVTGTEDSVHIDEDYKIVENFKKHNIKIDHYKLGELNIRGNGHMMMLEKNSNEIFKLILDWIKNSSK